MWLMNDKANCLHITVHNLLEHRQPNQFVISFTPHLKLLKGQCEIAEHQVTIFCPYLLNDDVKVVFRIEFRRKHVELYLVLYVLVGCILIGELQGKVTWLVQEVKTATDDVFARCRLHSVEHRLHLFVGMNDARFLHSIKERQRKVILVVFKENRSGLMPVSLSHLVHRIAVCIIHFQRSATRHHIIAIPLWWKLLGPHLELPPRQPYIRAAGLDDIVIMIFVLQ